MATGGFDAFNDPVGMIAAGNPLDPSSNANLAATSVMLRNAGQPSFSSVELSVYQNLYNTVDQVLPTGEIDGGVA